MANRNWSAGSRDRGSDGLDEYLHNEYRAEEGAYLERRPSYGQTTERDRNPAFREPRLPAEYSYDESFAGAGMAVPRDEPLHRGESGFTDRFRGGSLEDRGDRDREPRYSESAHHRSRRDRWQQDREAGRKLFRAAENFYKNLAGAVGLEDQGAGERGHRGRGPRNYRRSFERILEEVSQRLTDDAYIDASDIEVAVQNQEVTLSGTVATRFEKRLAEDIAAAVSGVLHVQNNLRVRLAAGTSARG
jgi:osmotically-inducible protein OsmY